MKAVRDPRKCPAQATFSGEYLLLLVLMMFCTMSGSRRKFAKAMGDGQLCANVWRMAGRRLADACHTDTMNLFMEGMEPEELEMLIVKIVGRIRMRKMLRRFLCDGRLLVAFDGTQIIRRDKPVGTGWIKQTQNGVTTYARYVLAAKIITAAGLVVPFAFEFIENPDGVPFDKQDCELKASRRLMDKIHRFYPRLRIVLLGDALFTDETTFRRCAELNWDFILTLKDDRLPSVTRQLPKSENGWSGQRRLPAIIRDRREKGEHGLRWQTPVTYHGDILHVIELTETAADGTRTYYNRWITNVKPHRHNALDLAQNGRLRWKIENEGTNTQKNGGYEMEHGYGFRHNAWKNYYLILQVSQLFHDLLRYTDIIQTLAEDVRSTFARLYGSMRCFAARLTESLRGKLISFGPLWRGRDVQIRFSTA